MPTIRLDGFVLPRAVQINIDPGGTKIEWDQHDEDLKMTFTLRVQESNVSVFCDLNRFDDSVLSEVHRRALDIARAWVDLISFKHGYGLTVVLDRLTDQYGRTSILLPQDLQLPLTIPYFDITGANFDAYIRIVLSDTAVFQALNDLVVSITLPHHAAVNCARAVETLAHVIAPGQNRTTPWADLRAALGADRP